MTNYVLIIIFTGIANDAGGAIATHVFRTESACIAAEKVLNTNEQLRRRGLHAFCFAEGDWRGGQ